MTNLEVLDIISIMSQSATLPQVTTSIESERTQASKRGERISLTLRFATDDEISHWDENVHANSPGCGSFLQSAAFARTKERFGWSLRYLVYEGKNRKLYALALEHSTLTLGCLWYITGLPIRDDEMSEKLLRAIVTANKKALALAPTLFMIKLEILLTTTDARLKLMKRLSLQKTSNIQSNSSTVVLDVSGSPESLIDTIAYRGRRCIRVSQRRNLETRKLEPTLETQRTMYELMKSVNGGKGAMMIRPFKYYRHFWTQFVSEGQGHFYGVYEDGRLVTTAFVIVYGDSATYKDGGSTPKRDQTAMHAYGLQWHIIQDLNQLGVRHYDPCGTPPSGRIADRSHPYYGLGLFKTSFNKQVVDRLGTYDQVLDPIAFKAWNMYAGKIIQKLYWAARHDLYW